LRVVVDAVDGVRDEGKDALAVAEFTVLHHPTSCPGAASRWFSSTKAESARSDRCFSMMETGVDVRGSPDAKGGVPVGGRVVYNTISVPVFADPSAISDVVRGTR